MVRKNQENSNSLQFYKNAVEEAEKKNDDQAMISALSELGFAHIQRRELEEGEVRFGEAAALTQKIQNIGLQVKCLGLKALAYHEINRLQDAYQVMNEILIIAEEAADAGIKTDALTSQGQILLDSGEPIIAMQKLEEARAVAYEIGDKRRQMNVLGVMGNQSMAVTALAQAEAYFDKASRLAEELGDTKARFGHLGNKGSVLTWQGNYREAIPEFEKVLDFVHKQGDTSAEIQAIRHLAQAHSKLNESEKALEYAWRGVELCKITEDETILSFYETIVVTYYRQGKVSEARSINQDAIGLAHTLNNHPRELDFLLSLGEAQFLSELHEDALHTYQLAVNLAKMLNRKTDEAYLTGRIGVALAELGRLEDAIKYHSQAVDFARLFLLPNLEGEQLSMLAMAYSEMGKSQLAQETCNSAIHVFTGAGLTDEALKASRLLEKIST